MEKMAITSMATPNLDFWRGKRVLVTGHSGFKGSWLTIWLHRLGAEVTGISLPPITDPNLFTFAQVEKLCETRICDIRDKKPIAKHINEIRPDIVFHLAAQPLVRASYRNPIETFATNVMGTAHVLNALRGVDNTRVALIVTTDKVYQNREWFWPYREDDALGGHDPYSASKAASEIVVASFRHAFLSTEGIATASARAGNVIGGGDWAEDRLIPDAIRAWRAGNPLHIRHPDAVRPWQHVLEPLGGYLILAQKLWEHPTLSGAYNFGPDPSEISTVRDIVELASNAFGNGDIHYGEIDEGPHEAGRLALENSKTRLSLGIAPLWSLPEAINRTMAWYRALDDGADALSLCQRDITAYEASLWADSPSPTYP
jgi:CDP-glucose 4,6-dehydratase